MLKTRRRRSPASVAVLAAVGVSALAASPASAAKHILPAGTPYAAKVSLTLNTTDSIHIDYESRTLASCTDGSDDIERYSGDYSFESNATYPQITVPLASRQELGRAYKKLRGKPTAKAEGEGGLSGSYAISGAETALPESGSCAPTPFSGSGAFVPSVAPSLVQTELKGKDIFALALGGPRAEPTTVARPLGPFYIDDQLGIALRGAKDRNPDSTYGAPDALALTDPVDRYKKLVHAPTLTKTVHDSEVGLDCGSSNDGHLVVSCSATLTRDVEAVFALRKNGLYRTKKDYPR